MQTWAKISASPKITFVVLKGIVLLYLVYLLYLAAPALADRLPDARTAPDLATYPLNLTRLGCVTIPLEISTVKL